MSLETLSAIYQHMSTNPEARKYVIEHAKEIIESAEKDLGPLTRGQRRDLLKDNTLLSDDVCYWAVDVLTPKGVK